MIELFHAVEGERSFGFFFLLALPDLTFIFFLSVDQYITGVDTISLSNYWRYFCIMIDNSVL